MTTHSSHARRVWRRESGTLTTILLLSTRQTEVASVAFVAAYTAQVFPVPVFSKTFLIWRSSC